MTTKSDGLRILVIREGENLVAQCLEHDIATQAPDMQTLCKRMDTLIEVERQESRERTGEEFGGLEPAPAMFHAKWDEAMKLRDGFAGHSTAIAA